MSANNKITAKEAARQVLAKAGKPLTVKEICEQVLAKKNLALAGKTPEATIAAVLHVAANRGELFRKVARGTFELLPTDESKAAPAKPAAKKPAAPKTPAAESTDAPAEHDPRGDVPGTKVVRKGGEPPEAKPDPKPTSRRKKVAAAA